MEDQSLAIEYRWAEGKYERLPGLAAELVRSDERPDHSSRIPRRPGHSSIGTFVLGEMRLKPLEVGGSTTIVKWFKFWRSSASTPATRPTCGARSYGRRSICSAGRASSLGRTRADADGWARRRAREAIVGEQAELVGAGRGGHRHRPRPRGDAAPHVGPLQIAGVWRAGRR